MAFVQNFPFFSILLCMISGIVTSILKPAAAKRLTQSVALAVTVLSAHVWLYTLKTAEAYTFMMGHFPAPFGNEIRIGRLEAMLATVFSLILFLTLMSGTSNLDHHAAKQKQNLFFIMVDLALAALLVMLYTNDLFTAYVFIEINTIAACAMIMIRQNGHTLMASTRYVIMNLLASGLLLLGIAMLYGITGHLLMPQLQETVVALSRNGQYSTPLTVVILLISIGLFIKSALFPFHTWAPEAYSSAPPLSAGILSGLVSKGYIFLLIKIYHRVFTMDVVARHHVLDVIFVFSILGMIIGSVIAIRQADINHMVAYSSVAQIGYVFMGLSMGTMPGVAAAIFHMLTHAAVKPVLFLSAAAMSDASGEHKRFRFLHGAAYRAMPAGIAFTIASFSMVGLPFTGGFISKIRLSLAGMMLSPTRSIVILAALAVSTLLNAVYFLQTVVSIYRRPIDHKDVQHATAPMTAAAGAALITLALVTLILGVLSGTFMRSIVSGLITFS